MVVNIPLTLVNGEKYSKKRDGLEITNWAPTCSVIVVLLISVFTLSICGDKCLGARQTLKRGQAAKMESSRKM